MEVICFIFISLDSSTVQLHKSIRIVGGGVHLGPFGTAATNMPTVPTPGDYDVGETGEMMIGRGNRSTRRKPAPVPFFCTTNPT
jgi:hypothetical protein